MKVFVHEQSVRPDFSSDGILIPTGAETDIVISQTNHNKLKYLNFFYIISIITKQLIN